MVDKFRNMTLCQHRTCIWLAHERGICLLLPLQFDKYFVGYRLISAIEDRKTKKKNSSPKKSHLSPIVLMYADFFFSYSMMNSSNGATETNRRHVYWFNCLGWNAICNWNVENVPAIGIRAKPNPDRRVQLVLLHLHDSTNPFVLWWVQERCGTTNVRLAYKAYCCSMRRQ